MKTQAPPPPYQPSRDPPQPAVAIAVANVLIEHCFRLGRRHNLLAFGEEKWLSPTGFVFATLHGTTPSPLTVTRLPARRKA